jgi:hypothetical protein
MKYLPDILQNIEDLSSVLKLIELFKYGEYDWISLVRFLFRQDDGSEFSLYLSVDMDNDEVILTTEPPTDFSKYNLSQTPPDMIPIQESSVLWFWCLRNQNGYFDAVQIECVTLDDEHLLFQFIVIASRIQIYRLNMIHK